MQLTFENVTVSYNRHPALHHINCSLNLAGTTTAIIGPNGAGKTTLLKLILEQVKPDSGRVIKEQFKLSDVAYFPQLSKIDAGLPLTVEEVVSLGLWSKIGMFNKLQHGDTAIINEALIAVGLAGFNTRYVQELSLGQLQRVLLARIIVQNAKLIVLDEPFSALDINTTEKMLTIIEKWKQEGKSVIVVLHNLHYVVSNFEYTMLLSKELIAYDLTTKVMQRDILSKAYANNFLWLDDGNKVCEL